MKVSLIDVCDFQGGTQPPKDEWIDHAEPGYVRMLQIRDFTQPDKEHIEYIKETKAIKTCTADDILIGRYGASVGKVLTGLSGAYNVAIVKTIPDNRKISKRYLFHYLNSPYFQHYILSVGSRAAQAGFNKEDLKSASIFLPCLDDQNDIVIELDLIDRLVALRKQQLAKLDELVKARFVEMFGESRTNLKSWQTVELQEVAEVGSSKRVFVEELQETGIPFFRGTEIGALAEGKKITPELFITQEHYQSLCDATGGPTVGDLLMPSICPDGRIWLVDDESPFYFKDGRVLWVHPTNKNINSCYLQHALKEKIMVDYASIASGTTFAELKIFALKMLQIMVPPLKQQELFSDFVAKIERQKLTIQHSFDKLKALKKSLMQGYFS